MSLLLGQVLLAGEHGRLHATDVFAAHRGALCIELHIRTHYLPLVWGGLHLGLLSGARLLQHLIVLLVRGNLLLTSGLPLLECSGAGHASLLLGLGLVKLCLVDLLHQFLFSLFSLLHQGKLLRRVVIIIDLRLLEAARLRCESAESVWLP